MAVAQKQLVPPLQRGACTLSGGGSLQRVCQHDIPQVVTCRVGIPSRNKAYFVLF